MSSDVTLYRTYAVGVIDFGQRVTVKNRSILLFGTRFSAAGTPKAAPAAVATQRYSDLHYRSTHAFSALSLSLSLFLSRIIRTANLMSANDDEFNPFFGIRAPRSRGNGSFGAARRGVGAGIGYSTALYTYTIAVLFPKLN